MHRGKRNFSLAALAATVILWGTGCIITTGARRDPYERCDSATDVCRGVTSCVAANTTTTPGVVGEFCTTSCFTPSDCPADPSGFPVACVTVDGRGQCYRQCGAGNTCPSGFTCAAPPGMTPFCVPSTGSSPPPSCGRVGQVCCAGNVCNDPGSACGTDGLCALAPYAGCSGSSIGQACLGGVTETGAVVGTTCQRPMIANPGPNGFCTATCSATRSMCPRPPAGFESRSYNCYILQGTSVGQCYIDCVGGAPCPAGTQCARTISATGAAIDLCMPMPS